MRGLYLETTQGTKMSAPFHDHQEKSTHYFWGNCMRQVPEEVVSYVICPDHLI